jgi:hypothetical protein
MKTNLSAVWLILFLAIRLSAQNSASHQIIINIIRPNDVSVSSLPAQAVAMDPSADATLPVSLLKWQTDGRPKKITLSTQGDQSLWIETVSPDVKSGKKQRVSGVEQNLLSADPRGKGQCFMKWSAKKGNRYGKPAQVALTVLEI